MDSDTKEDIMNAETIRTVKTQLKDDVEYKRQLTRERVEYKLSTRGRVPEHERLAWFRGKDLERWEAKSSIRYLHLVYGLIRGQHYKRMEPRCENLPSALIISEKLIDLGEDIGFEVVEAWLAGEASPFQRARRPEVAEAAA